MDIPRQDKNKKKRNRRLRQIIFATIGIVAIALITFGVSRLKPAAPSVERSTVWIDTVKRGPMLRQVRGPGTLVPEEVRVIAAATEGRVERILVQPGTEVSAGTVLLELINPTLAQEAQDAQFALSAGQADFNNLKVRLESDRMTQQAAAATVRADYQQAKLQLDTDEQLARDGLIPAITLRLSRVRTEELANRYKIEQQRLEVNVKSIKAQMAAQQARIQQLQALAQLRQSRLASMRVLAGTSGVLQEMVVEVGQQVTPGTNLARVAEPQHLKAELKIAETQAKDITLGQQASIDTRNGLIPGHVMRIDPAAQQGTVTVDVALDGELPQGARPALSVDGTIELERLSDVVFVGRPAFGQSQSTVGMFKLEEGGKSAVRVQVKLGRSSVNTVEIIEGLQPGEQVILSDTSAWDNYNRILLN
ncbi:MAG TPA: efflux RND transporter periplasmic adaptor subunit [Pyrinomonadaceae bacterium]|jgi:HlyD family secretion protein|nr:efflux RND transporter periplasmic adaptor subunit [Pyrinomonadaceae bacterium]